MKQLLVAVIMLIAAAAATAGTQDCVLGKKYLALASDRIASQARDGAVQFLQQSIAVCPSYEAYERLGELYATSADEAEAKHAAESFVAANDLAPSDPARAHTLYEYARLLDEHGDAQNADPLIRQARALDHDSTDIKALAARTDQEVAHPTKEGLVRGLKDTLFVPIHFVTARDPGGSSKTLPPIAPTGPQINLRINFETGKTAVDAQTRPNVMKLAEALRDPAFANRKFLFVGHADVRGDENQNVKLSLARAQAIYQTLLEMDASLDGRVETAGKGSSQPVDTGHDEAAYRANRRLQVLLK